MGLQPLVIRPLFGAFRPAVQGALTEGGHAAASFSLSVERPNVLVGARWYSCSPTC